mgnify:CR=1 FL=1
MSTLIEILGNSQYLKYSGLSVCLLAETEDKACLFKSNPGICYRDHCIFTGSRN